MGWAEQRGKFFRARYRDAEGKKRVVEDELGEPILYPTAAKAKKAAQDAEAAIRAGRWRDPSLGTETFGQYASRWYAGQELAESTMQNYKHHIEEHLLPYFGEKLLKEIDAADVQAWERAEKEAGYAPSSIKTWRGTLHVMLSDAHQREGLITSNPAHRQRGRGRRAGRSSRRAPEKAITTPLGALLVAERAGLLAGRDDEFVLTLLIAYTGMRWGEVVGLEREYVREHSQAVRVEHQLYEMDDGSLLRCPPKEDSYRTLDIPEWLSLLLAKFLAGRSRTPCSCHGNVHVFGGLGIANGRARSGVTLRQVAEHASVSVGTVSHVLNHPEKVRQEKREAVVAVMEELGYVRGGGGEAAAHHRRSGFATWVFHPAATGWYPAKAPQPRRLVPVLADPWPGVPARGRGAASRAEACWAPVAPKLTPHGLRHFHKTTMEDLGTPPKLMDERMGHLDGSVQARYTHITDGMRKRLMDGLTEVWEDALDARLAMHPRSAVPALDRLLAERAGTAASVTRLRAVGA
ncbi:LacI family transcriptional regulator [Streptomyces sp. NTH33]|uniref:LacI family DNA-binding transcriptional regulator n=1 Tax=Streptomyces sp. NTH33 TaxID=1735453 RepID=UPI000DAA67A9|nr:LacI family DNA-binding transcriptional regulator [Streptomyces sp. NTH33]PZG97837.1 LacI family transcriptional regulator [Streptomyces sp. NTH33]